MAAPTPGPEPEPGLAARRARREAAKRKVIRQRRIVALAVLVVLVAGVAGAIAQLTGGGSGQDAVATTVPDAKKPPPPPELPRGGRELFPAHRIVAYYGAPQHDELGALGIGTLDQAAKRLDREMRRYRRGGRTLLPALELIGVIAAGHPGADNSWNNKQPSVVVNRHLRAARRHRALLVIDIQPGHEEFMPLTRRFARWLREPDVGLALDPEWYTPGAKPGTVIGSTDAATVNRVAAYLSRIVKRYDLPEKLLIVHQFTDDMIRNKRQLRHYPGVALVLNVDGFGDRPNKISKYVSFTRPRTGFRSGFKLFYKEDTNLMQPRDVLRLRPRPDLVIYE